jgi:uncharacterized membrane protein YdjX (TVP38/TMEM64 family)
MFDESLTFLAYMITAIALFNAARCILEKGIKQVLSEAMETIKKLFNKGEI